jgi:[acyl-carrier-protein] S-malonyltransferase
MALGYLFGGGGVGNEPRGVELYEAFPTVQKMYAEVADWTGLTVQQILTEDLPEPHEKRQSVGTVREAVHALAVYDVLLEHGLRPSVVGGLSLGGMTASCLAGALTRQALFEMLAHTGDTPELPSGEAAQGLALAFVASGVDPAPYRGEGRPGVYVAGEFGPTADGAMELLMLSGEQEALNQLAADVAEGTVAPLPDRPMAVHSPLRTHFRTFMTPYIDAMPFQAPQLPLVSSLERKVLVTADDVRDMFDRNSVDPISLVHVYEGMKAEGVRLSLVMGGTIPDGVLKFPFPVVHVDGPKDIEQALTTVFELGIDVPSAQSPR